MRVACVVVPHFMVEVERLHRPALRGRPVVVAGQLRVLSSGFRGEGARNVERGARNSVGVLDCSPETMARGLRPGMPMREAMSRCAEAAFVEAHPERYEATTLAMVNALLELSPLVEPAEPGVIYFGVDGEAPARGGSHSGGGEAPRPLGRPELKPASALGALREDVDRDSAPDPMEVELAEEIVAVAGRASALGVRVGLADGKFAAYVAAVHSAFRIPHSAIPESPTAYQPDGSGWRLRAEGRPPAGPPIQRDSPSSGHPNGSGDSPPYCVVPPGKAAPFLAELSVEDLPVSAEMRRRLRLFGLRWLGDLAQIPKGAVAAQFGDEGARAWELAQGIDRALIIPHIPPKAVTERLAFAAPVDTADALLAAVRTLLGRALHRPQVRGRAARGLRLRLGSERLGAAATGGGEAPLPLGRPEPERGHHLEAQGVRERRRDRETAGGSLVREWEVTFREPVGSAERMLLAIRGKIEAAELPAPFTEVELTLLGICGESALQGNLFTVERGRQLERVAEAARQLKARYGRSILAKVIEVEPWSRIPERRFALIDCG